MLQESQPIVINPVLNDTARSALRALIYFDLFQYPLRAEEVWRSCDCVCSREEVQEVLEELVGNGMIAKKGDFFALPATIGAVDRRVKGNNLASVRMIDGLRSAQLIARFPYVQAVMISGSLSKNYMDPQSDVDFFVVTSPGRLWVARTMLILYKKIFLLNSHKSFCLNYFVDTDHLEIEDKNVFTATETVFLLPVVNYEVYQQFKATNRWAHGFFPNFPDFGREKVAEAAPSWISKAITGLLKGGLGDRLDAWCMRQTFNRWKKKFKGLDANHFEVAMRTRKYVSKHHPGNFQAVVSQKLKARFTEFETKHGVSLAPWSVLSE